MGIYFRKLTCYIALTPRRDETFDSVVATTTTSLDAKAGYDAVTARHGSTLATSPQLERRWAVPTQHHPCPAQHPRAPILHLHSSSTLSAELSTYAPDSQRAFRWLMVTGSRRPAQRHTTIRSLRPHRTANSSEAQDICETLARR